MKDNILQQLTKAELDFFKPVPFWSMNSDIEEGEVVRQIGEMHAYGLGGFVFHARTGLVTEYLSEEWFYLVGVALKTAKEYGMKVWIYLWKPFFCFGMHRCTVGLRRIARKIRSGFSIRLPIL